MGPVKDRYIYYEKAGDKFTGQSMTAISYLTKLSAILPPHWDFIDSTEERMEEKVDQLLSNNLVRENDVSDSTFFCLTISLCLYLLSL